MKESILSTDLLLLLSAFLVSGSPQQQLLSFSPFVWSAPSLVAGSFTGGWLCWLAPPSPTLYFLFSDLYPIRTTGTRSPLSGRLPSLVAGSAGSPSAAMWFWIWTPSYHWSTIPLLVSALVLAGPSTFSFTFWFWWLAPPLSRGWLCWLALQPILMN